VALICNLVQEFNGLVSKGSTAMLALLLLKKHGFLITIFTAFFQPPFVKKFIAPLISHQQSFPATFFT
jgi:hypothetical protein